MCVRSVASLSRCLAATLFAIVLTGCAMSGNSASNGGSTLGSNPAVSGGLTGVVYGGQQPIVGAAVTLWAAGTTGTYGAGATSIATTTSNTSGSFSFDSAGVSPCTTGQHLYITSMGGNAGGGINQYAALMAALPTPCGTSTASTHVTVNEVSTVASVTALQQFMSISPGGSPAWAIGAPATNVTGMANAFTQVGNLITLASGTSGATTATSAISGVTYTTTITPDSNKINTLANILAACVNTNGNGTCTNLFADATPGSSSAPTDTLQVAYYLATNSSGLELPAHGVSQGEPYYLCSTYIASTPPFQPSSACSSSSYPMDWAIGVSWSTSNGSIVTGTATSYSMAIDGLGNVWTAYSCSSGAGCTDTSNDADKGPAYVTEFNPQGQVQFAPVTSTTISTGPSFSTYTGSTSYSLIASRPFSLAIDTNNNAWYDSFYGATVSSSNQLGVITKIAQGGSSTGYLVAADAAGAISIDGNNNIYQISEPVSGRYYMTELEYDSGNYSTFDQGIGRATSIYNGVWADSLGYAWSGNSSCANPDTILRAKTSDEESASGADEVTNSTGCPNWTGAADSSGGAYFANGSLYHLGISGGSASTTAPSIVTEAAGTGMSNGGLDGGAGIAVDGLGNVWVANNSGGGVSEFAYTGTAFTPLSPAGTASVPVYGFGTSYLAGTKPIDVATDSSGNVWVGTQTTNLWYLVGIAGPTVTPISTMLKNSFVGSRPGAQTLVSLSPALNYSTVVAQSESLAATLTNTGSANVSVGTVSVSGTNSSDFMITGNTCGTTLNIGVSCTITVAFASSTPGNFSGQLNVASNAVSSPATAALTATAANAVGLNLDGGGSAAPSVPSLTFASMVAGGTSLPQDVVVTNTGSVPLTLTVAMSGPGANLFPETTNCGASVAPGATCDISVEFGPKVAGSYTASLTVTDNAGSGAQTIPVSGTATPFTITVNNSSASGWTIDNGAISFSWNASTGNLTSWVLDGTSDQLVDTTTTSNGQPEGLYMDNTGSFGNGNVPTGGTAAASTVACTIVGGTQTGTQTIPCAVGTGSTPYFDWSMTIPDSTNSGNAYTFVEHWVVFPNDPGVHTYVELVHSAGDPAGSVGQVQWVFRDNLSTFTNTYSVNAGLGLLGVQDIPQPSVVDTSSSDPGRAVQNAAEDLHGFNNLPAGFTRQFFTKYDYAGYEYLHQGQGVYGQASSGTTYGVWTVLPKQETLVGGPTKQDLFFTNNIDMIEAYSNHENNTLNLNAATGVTSNRLFGPYYIHVNTEGVAYNQSGDQLTSPAQMYSDAISAGAALTSSGQYDNDAQLVAAGYVPTSGRGTVQVQVNGVTGSQYTAWAVLSDPNTNFQFSCNGMQYWADISQNGTTTFTGVAPGTYRLSVYVLGQWGEYRQDGIAVTANNTTVVPTVNFVPENFAGATGETVFTIGTPDRSSHEFLHGHTSNGNDDREYWGNWNYWMDFAANQGAVVYYATAVGGTPASNNLNLWNYNHWGTFNPGLYAGVFNSSDDTNDGYQAYPGQEYPGVAGLGAEYAIPTYVANLPGASGTNGANTAVPAWQVYFATPANIASYSSGNVELSIAVACAYGSYSVTLNPQGANQQRAWNYTNYSDCNARSGLSGYTQWFVMEFPASALNPLPGASNELTISMSQTYGSEDDALRLELTNSTSNPTVTGWNDYTYIYGSGSNQYTLNNDAGPNP
jgi:hypothetical protein